MQKIGLVTAVIIWLLLAGKLINDKLDTGSDVIEAFSSQSFVTMEGDVSAFGEYGVTYLTEEEKEALLVRIANSLGIDSGYEISSVEKEETTEKILMKLGKNADTTIKVITVSEDMGYFYQTTQYVKVDIDFGNKINSVTAYRNLVEDVLKADGIDGNVTINLRGNIAGTLNYSEKNKIANALLKELNATVVSENRGNDIFTIYAYSENVSGSVICGGKKVNVNISEDYNEAENMTTIYLSTPLNNLDY